MGRGYVKGCILNWADRRQRYRPKWVNNKYIILWEAIVMAVVHNGTNVTMQKVGWGTHAGKRTSFASWCCR